MDSSTVFTKIKDLGHVNSKREELKEFCKLKIDQILKFLPRRILNSDGADLLDCILNGLPDNYSISKVKIVDIVLKTMRSESCSLTHCGDLISRICLELPRLPVADVVRWCNDSIQSIIEKTDVNMIWRDILPECLNAISSHDTIKHCGTEMNSADYKAQCIHTLCQCNWNEKQLVQLAAMFKDMQLLRTDHRQVVNKICSYLIEVSPETLPPLVHQLLKFCKSYNLEVVLAHLSNYFNLHLYSKLEPAPQDSESTTMDIDDIVHHSQAELSRCLSTCMYHISQGAAEPELIRKHIKTWPKTQLLRAPFLLDLALAVSDKGAEFRSVCLNAIKAAIEQRALDELRSEQSAWVRSILPPDVNVASVLKVLTTESANHRQLTVLGLINLAFSLLAMSRLKPVASVCWSHGKLILVRLCKSQPETARHILNQLADRLSGDATQRQYSECLHILCKLTPVSVERCSQLGTILENCQPTSAEYQSSAAVLDAVHPLLSFSTRTRDTLVMVCRKGLYSRDSMHRCLAVSGFLTVLRHIKLSRSANLSSSQSCSEQYSGHSYLTQLTVDLHATQQGAFVTSRVRNEAMCLEVVSILRRCLSQDAAVKQLLYSQLYDCAKDKPALHESVLELLYEHLTKYLPDEEGGDALMVEKCVQTTATSSLLVEPISRLLYVIAQFLQTVEEEDLEDILGSQCIETGSAHLRSKLTTIMEKLVKSEHLTQISLDDPGLTDMTPESQAKSLKVQQILQCYEALIAHQIMQWKSNSNNMATSVYKLFKACNELLEQTKSPSKLGKKGNKSTMNDTRDTVKSQKSQKSQKDRGKGPIKLSNMMKDRSGPFKPLTCLWDFKFCLRLLELLYSEEVPWCSVEQRNQLRARRDFHRWAIRSILSVIPERPDKRCVNSNLIRIAALLYKRCICRLQNMCNFDDQTALGCLEVFKGCIHLILSNNYALKIDGLLSDITGLSDTPASISLAAILENVHTALTQLEAENGEEAGDLTAKKTIAALTQLAAIILETNVHSSTAMNCVIIKLEDYVRTTKQDCMSLMVPLLTAAYREQQEAQLLDDLILKLTTTMKIIDEEDTSTDEESTSFPNVDSKSGQALVHVCAHLGDRFRCIEHLLLRARDLAPALDNAIQAHHQRIETELKELYKCIVIQLCQVTSWTTQVARLRCSVGVGSDRVLGLCVKLYALLGALFKQIPTTGLQLRLERLLKLSGKKLSAVMDVLIKYVEQYQEQQRASKVLRDTKLIPRLVLEAERFSKNVLVLSSKAKTNYHQYLSLGTARDFRIRAPVLEEVLNAQEDRQDNEDEENEEQNIHDAATDIILPASDNEEVGEDGREEETPRKKRRRLS